MLSLPPSVRIFVATGATDLRKSFDGLSGLAQSVLRQDPLSGHLFIFANRRRDRVKILQWDRSGFLLLYKRLEKGTFRVPERGEIDARELMMLLEGLDTAEVRERGWYRRGASRW
jgi:transposase